MKIVCSVIGICILCACSSSAPSKHDFTGQRSPPAIFSLMSGDRIGVRSFEGKKIAILFWSDKCARARYALDDFDELLTNSAVQERIVPIVVNVDAREDEERVQKRYDQMVSNGALKAFSGDEGLDEAYRAFEGKTVPYFILINESGTVTYSSGKVPDAEVIAHTS